eukprot:2766211-Pleurochrysis_carterae.AAC.6
MRATYVAFRHKPNSSHLHLLYLAKKNEDGMPIKSLINGKEQYEVYPQGIKIFQTKEAPTGMPSLADSATAVADSRAPRFDPEVARVSVMTIISELKDRFGAGDKNEWSAFFDVHSHKVQDILALRAARLTGNWIPKCTTQLPDGQGAMHEQAEFSESIRCINPICGTRAEGNQPILTEGSVVCPLPDAEARHGRVRGERLPFLLVVVETDKETATNNYGRRVEAISDDDTFLVSYLSVFDARGKLTNSVVGSWKPRCKKRNIQNDVHVFSQVVIMIFAAAWKLRKRRQKFMPRRLPLVSVWHMVAKELENVSGASILLYDIELTNSKHLSADAKMQIVRALKAHSDASAMLPR